MGIKTKIGWCDATINIWWGCVEVSPLCDNCYAREWSKRYDRAKWGADEPRLKVNSVWKDLGKLQRDAAIANRIDRVFIGSMMDIFEKPMPVVDSKGERMPFKTGSLRESLFNDVVPKNTNLLHLFLTKRPSNIPEYVPKSWRPAPDNVMFGTSIGTVDTLKAVDHLRRAQGRRFLSIEPLLEPLGEINLTGIEWVIVGCESRGKSAGRFADGYEDAARDIMRQCRETGARFFNKQMPINGQVSHDVSEWPADLQVQELPLVS